MKKNNYYLLFAISMGFGLSGCNSDTDNNINEAKDNTSNYVFTITSSAPTTATEDIPFSYQLITNKLESDSIVFSGENLPEGMTVSNEGLVTWTPKEGILTSGEITIKANLNNEKSITQSFTLNVTPVNDAPIITAITDQTVELNNTFTIQLDVTDPDDENNGSDLHYEIITGPENATISNTGLYSFQSTAVTSQEHSIQIQVSDGLEDNVQSTSITFKLSEYYYPVDGFLKDYHTGDSIESGTLMLSQNNTALATTTSNADGSFKFAIADINLDKDSPLTISANSTSYSEGAISINFQELSSNIDVLLPKAHLIETFSNTEIKDLVIDNTIPESPIIISLPTNSFVDANNEPVNDNIKTEVFIIDPRIDIDLMPGEMVTETQEGELAPIESFGAISATFTDVNGDPLQLAEGKTAEIRIPVSIPVPGIAPPTTIPLFYFDNEQGIWVEEGEATLSDDGLFYVGSVSHFTTWNADRIMDTVNIEGCVVSPDLVPLANARIKTEGKDYNGTSSAISDIDGHFSVNARKDSEVLISAENQFLSRTHTIYTDNEEVINLSDKIDSSDLSDNGCLILDAAISTITLTWQEHPRDLDSHLYGPINTIDINQFHIYYSNKQTTIETEEQVTTLHLDVDDTTSFGPEIITIPHFPLPGRYQYAVKHFSGQGEINQNEVRVELVLNGERHIYTPPERTEEDNSKKWWYVFDIIVNEEGTTSINDVNEFRIYDPTIQMEEPITPSSYSYPTNNTKNMYQNMLEKKYYAK
ncbi:putative Ig domain-containing protein [Photobacterium leiognathi]|uniref:putative Ig domain-containing protein n=1 Tax=Photobacterium leiognathi TaxID=553611 RepID=UPI002982AE6F|nr:Ig-like domain-containing protein [Photobacterium leiognathi]